jgi:hypothetical protein
MLQDVEGIGHPKLNIACKNAPLSKSFDMGKKSKLWIRSVYYYLKRCMEARFWKLASTGSTCQHQKPMHGFIAVFHKWTTDLWFNIISLILLKI